MILDSEKNIVYFSDLLQICNEYQAAFKRIKFLVDKHKINYKFLFNTKDIWCRDYMPIQISENEFIQFRYEPSYLENEINLQSNPKEVLKTNGLNAMFSTINLDGGNVVNSTEKIILTNRVFKENPTWGRAELTNELKKLFNSQVLIIPDINTDLTGHSDGHLRFIDSNTILVNELQNENKYWKKGFHKMIEEFSLNYVEMPWFEHKDKKYKYTTLGCYVNYLEIGNLILFPIFDIFGNKDEEALKIIHSVFPEKIIEPININEIGKLGGLMNCATWTIKNQNPSRRPLNS